MEATETTTLKLEVNMTEKADLTSERIHGGPGSGPGPVSPSISPGDGFLVKMDSEMLRKFFRSLNIPPPPGFPESE
jgi:hypothetical protein